MNHSHRFFGSHLGSERLRMSGDHEPGECVDPDVILHLVPVLAAAVVPTGALLMHLIGPAVGLQMSLLPPTFGLASVASIVAFLVFQRTQSNGSSALNSRLLDYRCAGLSLAASFLLVAGALWLLGVGGPTSAQFIVGWFGISAVLLFAGLAALGLYVRMLTAEGRLQRRIALYGDPSRTRKIASSLLGGDSRSVIVGIYDDVPLNAAGEEAGANPPGIGELVQCALEGRCDRIVIAQPVRDLERLQSIMSRIEAAPVSVQFCTDVGQMPYKVQGAVAEGHMLLLSIQRHPLGAKGIVIKTITDYVLALIAVVLLAPLMLMIAVAIKLDSRGPVFFVQARTGYRHKVIRVFKFRSMTTLDDGPVVVQATRNDSRITRVGRFLRRTSLDELPQLFNVLRGELSLVGPRPHALTHDKHYREVIKQYVNRAKMRPGMTGWAQVNGFRSETRDPELMRQRVLHDIYYIENWSPWLDAKILVRTVGVVFWDREAY
jgi:putative colanic acid biosynthesis UDP-glucose lipid carrier transferase